MSRNSWPGRILRRAASRRALLRTLGGVGLGVAVLPLTGRSSRADQATYFTWSGYDVPELFGSYRDKYGTDPGTPLFGDAEEAFQKLRAGFVADVIHPCSTDTPRWRDGGVIRPIDVTKLSNWNDVFPPLKDLKGTRFDGQQWFVPFDWGQTSITYRTDLYDLEGREESWEMLWDERYAGRLAMMSAAEDAWWCAAIYAGIDTDNVTDEGIRKVRDLLLRQRPLLRMYTNDITTVAQALATGEVAAAMTWNETAVELMAQGVPVKFANPKEGALTWVCGLVLHKDAPEPERAHDLIDTLIGPEAGSYVIDELGYGHSNARSFELVDEDRLAELGLSKNPLGLLDKGVFVGPQPPEVTTKINRDWEAIRAGF